MKSELQAIKGRERQLYRDGRQLIVAMIQVAVSPRNKTMSCAGNFGQNFVSVLSVFKRDGFPRVSCLMALEGSMCHSWFVACLWYFFPILTFIVDERFFSQEMKSLEPCKWDVFLNQRVSFIQSYVSTGWNSWNSQVHSRPSFPAILRGQMGIARGISQCPTPHKIYKGPIFFGITMDNHHDGCLMVAWCCCETTEVSAVW